MTDKPQQEPWQEPQQEPQQQPWLTDGGCVIVGVRSDDAPERCPITGLPFFGMEKHPVRGWVPTYGGPFNTYTIPAQDDAGEWYREWYDHDIGAWRDTECVEVDEPQQEQGLSAEARIVLDWLRRDEDAVLFREILAHTAQQARQEERQRVVGVLESRAEELEEKASSEKGMTQGMLVLSRANEARFLRQRLSGGGGG